MVEARLSEKVVQLLDKPVLGYIATLMKDGSPQVTPVWVDTDGEYILVNTSEGRIKARNLRRNPHVAISMADPSDPFMGSLYVRDKAVEITAEGADDHIDRLAKKYTEAEKYPNRQPGEVRLIVKIKPERISRGVTMAK